ncbi:hypothetical protein RFF05_03765 [Bengtsoniella intestinalis]|uniref:hypothetical protein n=1 Tax=Bengtsoniella intestinalis TaxID=3073143 RepID=UPI00391FC902
MGRLIGGWLGFLQVCHKLFHLTVCCLVDFYQMGVELLAHQQMVEGGFAVLHTYIYTIETGTKHARQIDKMQLAFVLLIAKTMSIFFVIALDFSRLP